MVYISQFVNVGDDGLYLQLAEPVALWPGDNLPIQSPVIL